VTGGVCRLRFVTRPGIPTEGVYLGRRRQIVLSRQSDGENAELTPLGKPDEVLAALAVFNTAPDGSPPGLGAITLYGPGMAMTMPTTQPEVTQLIANLSDEEIALPVLMRMCKSLEWSMTDMETGMKFR
jgi:hypothetical protein